MKKAAIGLVLICLSGLSGVSGADDWESVTWQTPSIVRSLNPPQTKQLPQKQTITIQGITFDSDYDNGSIGSITDGGTDTFNASLYVESGELGPRSYWFRFTLTGVAGRDIAINLDHAQNPRPYIRVEDGPWRRMTGTEAPSNSRMELSFGPSEEWAEVAFYHPLGYTETHDAVEAMADASPYATMEVIGQSYEGRDMLMVTVNDNRWPDSGKHRVWVHSRAHAGEVTSSHTMLGWLDQITAETPEGERLRRYCIFHVVPLLNVDGVYRGHTRWDSQGIDPERLWCDDPPRTPAVENLKTRVDAFMASANPIELSLNLHSTQGNWTDTFFFKHIYPSVSRDFEDIQQRYIDAFDNATPLFDNLSAQTSQLNACLFIESYYWNNWGEDVMALTHEGHFRQRITDNDWITGEDYRELGRAQAVALIEYFELPELGPPTTWQVY